MVFAWSAGFTWSQSRGCRHLDCESDYRLGLPPYTTHSVHYRIDLPLTGRAGRASAHPAQGVFVAISMKKLGRLCVPVIARHNISIKRAILQKTPRPPDTRTGEAKREGTPSGRLRLRVEFLSMLGSIDGPCLA